MLQRLVFPQARSTSNTTLDHHRRASGVTGLEQDYFYTFKRKSKSFVMQKNYVVIFGGFWQKKLRNVKKSLIVID
jgi:hypothetical protein